MRSNRLIYLDSAATTLQKPPQVQRAVLQALRTMSSPGRGGYASSMRAAETVWNCRCAISEMYGIDDPTRVVFTYNATHALNIAILSVIGRGDRVLVTGYEHNAVMRTLYQIGAQPVIAAFPPFDDNDAMRAIQEGLSGVKAAVVCHVSNVFGSILPLREVAETCKAADIPLIVDASQSAGSIPFPFDSFGLRFAAMPGHKGLFGPQGTGVLLCTQPALPLLTGGTGSDSFLTDMPDYLPDRLEAGTHNVCGIAGLLAGVTWVNEITPERILRHERRLTRAAASQLRRIPGVEPYFCSDPASQAGVLSFTVSGVDCEQIAAALSAHGIAVRAGFHCAPLAHQTGGTAATGTVRMSFSPFNTEKEVEITAETLDRIVKKF